MNNPPVELLFLSKQDIDALITYPDVVDAVEQVFRADGEGQMVLPGKDRMVMNDSGRDILLPMSGYLKNIDCAGVKWMRYYPTRPDDIPSLWGQLLILSNPRTGLPIALMDATTITAMRTAGGHAVVAARYLARPAAQTLSILGCGAQGQAAIASFSRCFPGLKTIRVFTRNLKNQQACIQAAGPEYEAKLQFVDTIDQLLEQTDILLTATTSSEVLIKAHQIPPGCFVAAMSSFRDLDLALSHWADRWVLGHRTGDRGQILQLPDFKDKLDETNVYATLGEIVCGQKPGRETDHQTILYTHMGMGSLDVAVGHRMMEKAIAQGKGQRLRLI